MVYEAYDHEGTRKLVKKIGAFICLISLTFFVFTWSASELTEYDTLHTSLTPLAKEKVTERLTEQDIQSIQASLTNECYASDTGTVSIPQGRLGFEVDVKCSDVRVAATGQFSDVIVKSMIDNLYYQNFDCGGFISCLIVLPNAQKGELIFSEKAHNFYNAVWVIFILFALISGGMIFYGSDYWHERFRVLGIVFLIAGAPYFILQIIKASYPTGVITQLGAITRPLLDEISFRYLILFLAAMVFLLFSYVYVHVLHSPHDRTRDLPLSVRRSGTRVARPPITRAKNLVRIEQKQFQQAQRVVEQKLKPVPIAAPVPVRRPAPVRRTVPVRRPAPVRRTVPVKPAPVKRKVVEGRIPATKKKKKKPKVKMRVREWVVHK